MSTSADIVLITPVEPGASGFGLRMRAGMLLGALQDLGDVRVVVIPVHGGSVRTTSSTSAIRIDRNADERTDLVARLSKPGWRATVDHLHPRPSLCRGATVDAAERVADAVEGASLVVTMRAYLAPFLDAVLQTDGRPRVVLDVDDIESVTHGSLGHEEEAARFERLERHYLPLFDRVLVCSEDDQAALRTRYGARARVVPNEVRVPSPTARSGAPGFDLVFVGNYSYLPNAEGAHWFCNEVVPYLPDVTVGLVGHNPGADVVALGRREKITVTGTVAEVGGYYASAGAAVVPLLRGGGTSIKLLEAMAHRTPVITTTVGARGVPIDDGLYGCIADTPEAFAHACRRVLSDPTFADAMTESAFSLVERRHAPDKVRAALRRAVAAE